MTWRAPLAAPCRVRSFGVDLDQPVTDHLRRDVRPLKAGATVGDALASLRGALLPERIVYFYVEEADGSLVGVVPTRRLLAAAPHERVATIMVRDLVTLPETASLGDASEALLARRLLALPVVDAGGRIVGTIEADVFSQGGVALGHHAGIDDIFQVIGVHVARARRPGAWGAFRERFPWLLANIGGGLACAALVARYEAFLDLAIVLALFMPVVLALAESVSIQSMTLTLHTLHAGPPSPARLGRDLARELATALLLGAACGAVVGSVVLALAARPARRARDRADDPAGGDHRLRARRAAAHRGARPAPRPEARRRPGDARVRRRPRAALLFRPRDAAARLSGWRAGLATR